jgi:hypothetical protein
MRVEHHTGIRRLRTSMDGILFKREENVLNESVSASADSEISFEASFGFKSLLYT